MPLDHKFIREVILDRCLSGSKLYNVQGMMEEVNRTMRKLGLPEVNSRVTINSDLHAIEERHAALLESVQKGKNVYWRYMDPDFSIFKGQLTTQEVIYLQVAVGLLQHFKGLPELEWIGVLMEKCQKLMKEVPEYKEFVCLDHNPYAHGLEYLSEICDAIANERVLNIWYHSFRYPEPQKNMIHPYYLKQYNQRWFLFCYHEHRKEIANYPLDRIEKVEVCYDVKFVKNDTCDFDEFFDDMIGVSREKDDQPTKVLLWVCKQQVPYIETKPLHGSQKVKERREDGTVFELDVVLNYELEQQILLQGEKIEVLEPPCLREKISLRIKQALDRYKE